MRVLVIHTFYKLKGGEDSVVANEMELLQNNGIEVNLLSFSNAGGTLLKLIQTPFNWGAYRKTIRKINSFKPDVIHLHNLHFSGSASIIYAARKLNIPMVMTLHNYRLLCPSGTLFHDNKLFLSSLTQDFPWTAVKKGVYQQSKVITFWMSLSMALHEKLNTWKSINKFIVLGAHTKALFLASRLAAYAPRIVVKPNFCYPDDASKVSDNAGVVDNAIQSPAYLYVGRLTEEKGVKVLLAAFSKSGFPLTIVGMGPLEELVSTYVRDFPNIRYLGQQGKEVIFKEMKNASALIFPSLWYETFGMVVIEAFARGLPVIASNLGNMKTLILNEVNGLNFEAGSSEDLIEKVQKYQEMNDLDKAVLKANALKSYEDLYSPEQNARQLINLYQDVILEHWL